jgi:hypothetical protein
MSGPVSERLSPVLLALGNNKGLKTLTFDVYGPMEESLSTAMQNGLGMNETLESLQLIYHGLLVTRKLRFVEQGVFVSPHQHCSQILGSKCNISLRYLPPFVSTLRPCCKRTRNLEVSVYVTMQVIG